MPRVLTTERLTLRPLRRADAPALAQAVFAEGEVATMLFHDCATPARQRHWADDWCEGLGEDGARGAGIWRAGGLGAFAIEGRPEADPALQGFLGVVGFYGATPAGGGWAGEVFYALARPAHGRGAMTEAASAALGAFRALPGPLRLYATVWDRLNPASIRVLERLGLVADGRMKLLDEYAEARVLSLADYELGRLRAAPAGAREALARTAALKLGHMAHEGLVAREDALARLAAAAPEVAPTRFAEAFDEGAALPGLAVLRWSRA
ncbi:GNAT family N-acetyltransferase [Albimonas pacifica]|uniref:Protein N-acetyltransferase, RimJ/RimL family n=1 Tax=Albimonas pacifica TaxID=1114924 RepID=A0A1I3F3K4_9RHOB|nr:GNAT family N-acetyltransferase [Albimonas pacifica]SFI05784.1 Protein N-acetyltransferase, RimJ/RimL family [Albimonas pacifica]